MVHLAGAILEARAQEAIDFVDARKEVEPVPDQVQYEMIRSTCHRRTERHRTALHRCPEAVASVQLRESYVALKLPSSGPVQLPKVLGKGVEDR